MISLEQFPPFCLHYTRYGCLSLRALRTVRDADTFRREKETLEIRCRLLEAWDFFLLISVCLCGKRGIESLRYDKYRAQGMFAWNESQLPIIVRFILVSLLPPLHHYVLNWLLCCCFFFFRESLTPSYKINRSSRSAINDIHIDR